MADTISDDDLTNLYAPKPTTVPATITDGHLASMFPAAPAVKDTEAYQYIEPGSLPNVPTTTGDHLASVVDAAKQAYNGSTNLLNPDYQQWLDKTSPATGYVVHGVNALIGGLAGAYRGTQEALVQAGVPKDVVSIPDAFAGSPNMLTGAVSDAAMGAKALVGKFPEAPVPAPEPPQAAPYDRNYYPDTETSATPQAGGAAATPAADAAMSGREIAAAKLTAEQTMLNEPASARATNGVDTTEYVKGSVPTQAEYDTKSNATQQRADLENPAVSGQNTARNIANNDARVDHFDMTAGSPVTTMRLEDARTANGEANLQTAWNGRIATNAQPVVDTIDSILKSPDGKLSPVEDAMAQVKAKLYVNNDPSGALEQDPAQLYGARKQINNMLSSRYQRQNPTAADAAPQLQQVMRQLDDVIEKGAPGYSAYKAQWAADSAPIEVEKYLQGKRADLFDVNNNITPNKVQTMMKGIVSDRAERGANPAKSITDDQMSSLWDLRNDLARRNNIDLGKARGSNTVQTAEANGGILTRTAKAVTGNALWGVGQLGLNAAGEAVAPGLGYALNSAAATSRMIRSQSKQVQAAQAAEAAKQAAFNNRVAGYFAHPPGWGQPPP